MCLPISSLQLRSGKPAWLWVLLQGISLQHTLWVVQNPWDSCRSQRGEGRNQAAASNLKRGKGSPDAVTMVRGGVLGGRRQHAAGGKGILPITTSSFRYNTISHPAPTQPETSKHQFHQTNKVIGSGGIPRGQWTFTQLSAKRPDL